MDVRKVIMQTEEYRLLRGVILIGVVFLANLGIISQAHVESFTDNLTMATICFIAAYYTIHEFRVKVLHSNAAVEEEKTTFMQFIKNAYGKLFLPKEPVSTGEVQQ